MAKNCLDEYKPALAMAGLQFVYAASGLVAKAALAQGMSPMVFVTYRQAIAALVLVPTTLIARRERASKVTMGIKGYCLVFIASLIGASFSQTIFYHGMRLSSASTASAVGKTIPAITFLMAVFLGLEKVQMRSIRSIAKVVGTVTCVGGAVSMAIFKGQKLLNMEFGTVASIFDAVDKDWMMGCFFLLGSSSCWSIWLILQVPICKKYLDPLSFSAWMCSLATLQSACLALFVEPELSSWKVNSSFVVLSLLYLGIIGSGFAYFVQSWCISQRGPLFAAMFNPLGTVIVTIMASLLLDEQLYTGSLVGAVAVVCGLYIVLWGKAKDIPAKEESRGQEEDRTKIAISVQESANIHDSAALEKPLLS